MKFLLALIVVTGLACAQTPTDLPANFIATGVALQTTGKSLHSAAPWVVGAIALGKGVYSYNSYNSTLVAGKLQTSITTGAAIFLRRFGVVDTFTFGSVGATQTASAITSAASTGGIGVIRLPRKWDIILTGQFAKTSGTEIRLGIGRSF